MTGQWPLITSGAGFGAHLFSAPLALNTYI